MLMRVCVVLTLIAARSVCADVGDPDLLARLAILEARWTEAMEQTGVPGFAVAVTDRNGVVYARGFGHRSLDPVLPFTLDTPAYIASVTKVFTAAAVMQLVERGLVDLDTPVKTYLPRFSLKDKALTESITVRDLLCHRYGLSSDPIVFAEAYTGQITDDLFYRELASADIAGTWEYSNLHFTLLGRVIESVTGENWRDYLQKNIFSPLHLDHTTARASELYGGEGSAVPLMRSEGAWVLADVRKTDSTMHAAGGMGSSALDLATWLRAWMNHGEAGGIRILSENSVREMLSPQSQPGTHYLQFERPEMGLGWYLGRYRDQLLVHHFGSYTGAHAHCSFMPSAGIGVAVIANWDDRARALLHQVAADIYDAKLGISVDDPWPTLLSAIKPHIATGEKGTKSRETAPLHFRLPLSAYSGAYTSESWGTLELIAEGETLEGRIGSLPLTFDSGHHNRALVHTPLGEKWLKFETFHREVTAVHMEDLWDQELDFRKRPPESGTTSAANAKGETP